MPLPAELKNGAARLFVKHVNDLVASMGSPPIVRTGDPKVFIVFATAASSETVTGKEKLQSYHNALPMIPLEETVSSKRAGKIYRDRYEALTASSVWECPVCQAA